MMAVFEVSTILFMVIVAPLWLVLHYRSKRQQANGLDEDTVQRLELLCDQAEQMITRIEVLEQLLDNDVPDWREKS